MANRIKFSENWDKLARPRFTTIRSYSKEKEEYFRCHIGQPFTILRVKNIWSYIGRKIGNAVSVQLARALCASLLSAPSKAPPDTIESYGAAGRAVA